MSHRVPVPGALRRVSRERSRLVAVLLVGVITLAGSGIQASAAAVLRATLNENWRGAYDILVTPAGATGVLGELLPPNALLGGGSGLTLDDLAAIRAVAGVEVAAPIGEVIAPGLKFSLPQIAIPRSAVGAETTPQAFRVNIEYTTDDGLGERVVSTDSMNIVVDGVGGRAPATPCVPSDGSYNDYAYTAEEYPALGLAGCNPGPNSGAGGGAGVYSSPNNNSTSFWDATESTFSFTAYESPQSATRITVVDPVAERALLGDAGDFLDPLIDLDAPDKLTSGDMLEWAKGDAGKFGADFIHDQEELKALISTGFDSTPEELDDLRRLWKANGDDYDAFVAGQLTEQLFTPMIVSEAPTADLTMRITVEAFGDAAIAPLHGDFPGPVLPAAMVAGEAGELIGTTAADISGSLNPFLTEATANVAWPGTDLAAADSILDYNSLTFQTASQAQGAEYHLDGDTIVLSAGGYRDPNVVPFEPGAGLEFDADGTQLGVETAYTNATRLKMSQGMIAVPVGTLPDESITATENELDYVPLGAYGTVGSKVTGGEFDGAEMQPAVTGLGLVSSRTAAIVSLDSAQSWGGDVQVSAVRVRVGGISAYGPNAQNRVVAVANALEQLGVQATVVAGSSPADTEVLVGDYAFGTADAAATQRVGTLGTVDQAWSELGAAARADLAVSTGTMATFYIALASAVALMGAVELAGLPGRREQSIVMREIGFTRRRVARWFAGEHLPGLIVVLVVGAIAIAISRLSPFSVIAVATLFTATVVTSALAIIAGSRPVGLRRMGPGRSRRSSAGSVAAFGLRQAAVHRLTSATHILAISIVSLSAVALVVVITQARDEAGASLIAAYVGTQQLIPQLALGGAGITIGLVLARIGRRRDLALRATQWETLRAAGWTTREVTRAQRIEGISVVLPALSIGVLATWAGATILETALLSVLLATSIVAGCVAAIVIFSARRKGTTL